MTYTPLLLPTTAQTQPHSAGGRSRTSLDSKIQISGCIRFVSLLTDRLDCGTQLCRCVKMRVLNFNYSLSALIIASRSYLYHVTLPRDRSYNSSYICFHHMSLRLVDATVAQLSQFSVFTGCCLNLLASS